MKHNLFFLICSLVATVFFTSCGDKKESSEVEQLTKEPSLDVSDAHVQLAGQPGVNSISGKCQACHQDTHQHWQKSHHGQANRLMSEKLDGEAFSNKVLETISEKWEFSKEGDKMKVTADGKGNHAGMAIGLTPLIQYLVSADRGRWQTPSVAWDPAKKEWFDTLGGEERTDADWGHWSGGGMNWNSQCAWCHMTDYKKNYDLKTDSYQSTWKEMGVGCTQCHGDLAAEADPVNGCLIDLAKHKKFKASPDKVIDNCASCHSRRGRFDGEFYAGDKFGDHFRLQLPTSPRLYYADGQIKDEDYVWTSLKLSNMGHKGVHCLDCHDPHTTKLKKPIEDNSLCMSCHASGTNGRIKDATIINPVTHSGHQFGSAGSSCVACHMTHTTYMGRDPRRDHGFHVPDPQMTKEFGIPNACNKCHTDKDVDWAVASTKTMFGEKMHTPERNRQRARTRAIASAFNGRRDAIEGLLSAYAAEENPTWQATLIQIMQAWSSDPRVQEIAKTAIKSEDSMVRASAVVMLEFGVGNGPLIDSMLNDPVREVRMAAGWASRSRLDQESVVKKELEDSFRFSADQPAALMSLAQLANDANRLSEAEDWMKQAIAKDLTSAAARESYAVLLGRMKRPAEALEQLKVAAEIEPNNPRFPYLQALTYAELGDTASTEKLLRKVVTIAPGYDRAQYNLGLLLAGKNELDEAILCILKAERANSTSPDYPYARATLHMRQGDNEAAFEACRTALGIQRDYQPALNLLRQIVGQSRRKQAP